MACRLLLYPLAIGVAKPPNTCTQQLHRVAHQRQAAGSATIDDGLWDVGAARPEYSALGRLENEAARSAAVAMLEQCIVSREYRLRRANASVVVVHLLLPYTLLPHAPAAQP